MKNNQKASGHDPSGHRKRVKARFMQEGLEHFDPVHALELLLFYAIPRVDTKPLARRLIGQFGSFSQVIAADKASLMQVEGVGEGTAAYIMLLGAAMRYNQLDSNRTRCKMLSPDAYGPYLKRQLSGLSNEQLYMLCLNARGELICSQKLGEGGAVSLNLSCRELVRMALTVGAASVILGHNHPGGTAEPSRDDIFSTNVLTMAFQAVDVVLVDHVIVAGDAYASMASLGCCPRL